MSLLGTVILGGMALLFGLGGLALAADAVGEFLVAGRVVTGPGDPDAGDGERATYLSVTLADAPDVDDVTLGQVHDTFGYWLTRFWASGGTVDGLVAGALLALLFRPADYRSDDDRRRGWGVAPASVPVRMDGRLFDLEFGEDAYPLQRLEADGMTVPWLAGVAVTAWALVLLGSPLLETAARLYPAAALAALGVASGVPLALVAGKVYHDVALVGRWSRVVDLGDPAVPPALAEAGDTVDPPGPAKVDLATASPGDTLRVVGTVDSTPGGLHVVDGVVSTRGRVFLAVAATIDAVRTLAFAAVALLVAGVALVSLFPSLAGL